LGFGEPGPRRVHFRCIELVHPPIV
jgi:hypothetical protein